MVRKARKSITQEIVDMVRRLLLDENLGIKEISRMVDLDRKTVSKIRDTIEVQGSNVERQIGNESVARQTQTVKAEDIIIKNFVACKNDATLKEIADDLKTKTDMQLSVSTICRKLKGLVLTRKRLSLIPEERNSQDKIDKRSIYAMEISSYGANDLVYLDETGFNKHLSRKYGYSPKNIKAYKQVPANRGTNLSCMCVISYTGLIGYELKSGAYNSVSFIEFIENYLVEYFRAHPQKVLIMDNARFHHSAAVLQKLRELQISFIFLPPYSPQLNPIEEFFSMLKSRYCALNENVNTMEDRLSQVFSSDFAIECAGFYNNMLRWLEKARQGLEFV